MSSGSARRSAGWATNGATDWNGGGLHATGGLTVRQMRDQGVKAPLMGGDGMADSEFAAIAGPGPVSLDHFVLRAFRKDRPASDYGA